MGGKNAEGRRRFGRTLRSSGSPEGEAGGRACRVNTMPQGVTSHALLDPRRLCRTFDGFVVNLAMEMMPAADAAFGIHGMLLRRKYPKTPRAGGVLDGVKRSPQGEAAGRGRRIKTIRSFPPLCGSFLQGHPECRCPRHRPAGSIPNTLIPIIHRRRCRYVQMSSFFLKGEASW